MKYWQDPFEMKMEQYRAIRKTANLGEPLDGDDALALLDIADAILTRLGEYQDREAKAIHRAIHGAEYPHTPNLGKLL